MHKELLPRWAIYQMTTFACLSPRQRRYFIENEHRYARDNSEKFRLELYKKYGYRCIRCNSTKELSIDHILPIAKGGTTVMKNLQILCQTCNTEKADTFADYRPQKTSS